MTINSIANDSIYTKIKEPVENMEMIEKDINSSIFILPSPKGYTVTFSDGGGRALQLSIEDNTSRYYIFDTEVLPNVIEWRMNKYKKIIGFIVRSTSSDFATIGFKEPTFKSKLHIVMFNDEAELIGYETNNTKARSLLDCKYMLFNTKR